MVRLCLCALSLLAALPSLRAQTVTPTRYVVYKHIGDAELKLQIFEPPALAAGPARPAIVLFFGGGWINGDPSQLYPQCARLAAEGMVAMSAEYRIASKHHTTPKESVMDAKSCLRWIQGHAAELHVDPSRLAAGGASAGGHLAIAAVALPGLNETGEDPVPIRLAALVLFNPVVDNGPGGYGYDRVKDYFKAISPMENLRAGLPPTIAHWGTQDKFVPVATAEKFKAEMLRLGNRCEVDLYAGQAHGFFNFNKPPGNPYYERTMAASEAFLRSLGLIPGPAAIANAK